MKKRLKEIERKVNMLIMQVDILQKRIILDLDEQPTKTNREKAQDEADEHYWDPTKHPQSGDSDSFAEDNKEIKFPSIEDTVSETNEHFE